MLEREGLCLQPSRPDLADAQMAEAYALKEGLMLAQHIGANLG